MIYQLKVIHSVARVHGEEISGKYHYFVSISDSFSNQFSLPAGLCASPVELPLVLGAHRHPAPLLHVGDDDGLVHVGAVGHLGAHPDVSVWRL